MRKILMFYPENDVALASGQRNFTAPKNAVALRRDCGFLLRWIADDGDFVVYESVNAEWEAETAHLFRLPPNERPATFDGFDARPWGWSLPSRKMLLDIGVSIDKMPDDSKLERLRQLSNRRTSIEILRRLAEAGVDTPPLPVEITDAEQLTDLLNERGRVMVKAPWSSSGRGIIDSDMLTASELTRRCAGIIRRQGSVVVEKFLLPVRDFAMLFNVEGGAARFAGFSVFENNERDAYTGNVVASQSVLENLLSQHVSFDSLHDIARQLESILSDIIGADYEGYCGVDMLIYKELGCSEGCRVNPCIELNLRMTMGVVALKLADKILADGSVGRMTMQMNPPMVGGANPLIVSENQLSDCANRLVFSGGRLVSGRVALTPPRSQFGFCLTAEKMPD